MPGMGLDVLLARQAGVISREQAFRAGLDAAAVDRLVRTRRWRPLHPRVYLVSGYGCGDEVRARAAVLWAGEGAVLSGAAAAWWHGLLVAAPATLAVIAPTRRPGRHGVAVRCRQLDPVDRGEHRGLPVTSLGLTVLEAGGGRGGPAGGQLLHRALQKIGWGDVRAAHRRSPTLAGKALLSAATGRGSRRDLHHVGARIGPSTGGWR